MPKKHKYRYAVLAVALAVLSVVSVISPEAAENVARAFILLWGAGW